MMARSRGFSVLEMVVAMAILAAVLVPMLTLQNQLLSNFIRYDDAFDRMTLTRNALAVLEDVNPVETDRGSIAMTEDITLFWTATPVSSEHANALGDGTRGSFRVQLFLVEGELRAADGRRVTGFSYETLGHRQTGNSDPFGG
jgi:general secretion pathway protein I